MRTWASVSSTTAPSPTNHAPQRDTVEFEKVMRPTRIFPEPLGVILPNR